MSFYNNYKMEFLPYDYKFGEIVRSYKLVLVCYHKVYGTRDAEYVSCIKSMCKEFSDLPFLSEDHGDFPMMYLDKPKVVLYRNGNPIMTNIGYKPKVLRKKLVRFFDGYQFRKFHRKYNIPDYSIPLIEY